MGHSGAFTSSFMGDVSAEDKLKAFKHAGIQTITHPGQAGERMKQLFTTTTNIHPVKPPPRNQQVVNKYAPTPVNYVEGFLLAECYRHVRCIHLYAGP